MEVGRLVFDLPLLLVLGLAVWTDVRDGKVYNRLTYPAALLGLVLNATVRPPGVGLGQASLGLAVGFIPLFLAFAVGGLGGGDVKLMGAVGAFLGPWPTV
ncbi:MAG: prepilin peptidase, partial [Planctomycetota bacterium]